MIDSASYIKTSLRLPIPSKNNSSGTPNMENRQPIERRANIPDIDPCLMVPFDYRTWPRDVPYRGLPYTQERVLRIYSALNMPLCRDDNDKLDLEASEIMSFDVLATKTGCVLEIVYAFPWNSPDGTAAVPYLIIDAYKRELDDAQTDMVLGILGYTRADIIQVALDFDRH